MQTSLINIDIELIKINYLSRLRYLEFQIYLNEIKYKMALDNIERKMKSLNESINTYGRNYCYTPIKLTSI